MQIVLLIVVSHVYCILLDQLNLEEWVHTIGWCWLNAESTKCATDMPSRQYQLWLDFILVHIARDFGMSHPRRAGFWSLGWPCRGRFLKYNAGIHIRLELPHRFNLCVAAILSFKIAILSPKRRSHRVLQKQSRTRMSRLLLEAVMYFDSCSANKWSIKFLSDF